MILNPVISGGGAEKEYKITDNAGIMLTGKYPAGEIVTSGERIFGTLSIKAADGTKIPFFENENRPGCFFVMPAQDVTLATV